MANDRNNPGNRRDPLPVFCFLVSIDIADAREAPAQAFFKSVSGIRYETEVVPVREGGVNNSTFQLPGATKWSNIVLKQGFTGSSALMNWREAWMTCQPENMIRANGTITQLNTARKPMAMWSFFNAWPCKWELSEFDASKSELAIETLELAIDGLLYSDGSGAVNAYNPPKKSK